MDPNDLVNLSQRYYDNRDFIDNEESTKMALIVPFIRLLGYDPNSPREVRLEYTAEFTQGDGKRLPDRMDYAIFDATGSHPLLVIEAKPLKMVDLHSKTQQLARYIAQMPELHFGVITNGCQYLFFGDLEEPNVMDKKPFFRFSLDDDKADWSKIAKFLVKFSRDVFNSETLRDDAENSRFRQEMIEKLVRALKTPGEDEGFMKWLTDGVYRGKRTTAVMNRLSEVAKDAIEPALLKVIGTDFVEKLRHRIEKAQISSELDASDQDASTEDASSGDEMAADGDEGSEKGTIVTTEEEIALYETIRDICVQAGRIADDILYKDTLNYFNVSYKRPTKWFVRFFGDAKNKNIVTTVPVEEARDLCSGFEVGSAPNVFGKSRVYISSIEQIWALRDLVLRSLALLEGDDEQEQQVSSETSV